MAKKIAEKLWKMYLFREEAKGNYELYNLRNARLSGAFDLANAIGFKVFFNPLAEANENPFTIEE